MLKADALKAFCTNISTKPKAIGASFLMVPSVKARACVDGLGGG